MNLKQTFSVFKNRNFLKMFTAAFANQMGSVIGMFAFTLYLLDRFSSQPVYATVTELMYSLPTLFVFFIVGVVADRMDRQKIASNCNLISAVLSFVLLGAIFTAWMPLIFAVLFLRSAIAKFFFPAESAMVQGILSKDDYTTAAGLNQMMGSIFMLFGTALGAFVYWTLGVEGALIIDGLSFIVSAMLIRSCRVSTEVRMPNGSHKWKDLRINMVFKDFFDGLKYILGNRLLLSLIFGFFIFGIVNGSMSVMPMFIMKYKLVPDTYEQMMVWMGVVFGIGILLGSIVASVVVKKVKLYQAAVLGLLVSGLFLGLSSSATNIVWFLALTFFSALFIPFINIAIGGWMPQIVDPKMMGRVQGWINPLMMLSQSVTLGLIAVLFPSAIAIEFLFWLVAICLMVVGVFYLITLPKYEQHDHSIAVQNPELVQ